MELELFDYLIDELRWGERTALTGKSFSVHAPDLQELRKDLSQGIHVDYEIARPGESKRIVHVLDTVLPIAKLSGHAKTFPGFDGPAQPVARGKQICLTNILGYF